MGCPQVTVYQRQRRHRADLKWLRKAIQLAVPRCLAHAKDDSAPLRTLPEIEASIVTDKTIGQVHADFLGDPSPTDVITFHHGEILVSADTAAREGPSHGLSFDEELLLYLIHGLMHLGGWDDHEAEEAAQMKALQEKVLDEVRADVLCR
ncbi:MAG: ybeY [Verrucomicrobiaceae bacterium]|nr:ybeY [Verrucomicrobiaceae bacterium]